MKNRLVKSPQKQAEEILLQRRNKTETKGSQTKKQAVEIYVTACDMETNPDVTVKGKSDDLVPVLAYTISEIIDTMVNKGIERSEAERAMVAATQSAILVSRIDAEAYENIIQKGEKNHDKNEFEI